MRTKRNYIVIAFDETEGATQMEQYAAACEVPGRVIPLPPAIDAGCGLAWKMDPKDYEIYKEEINSNIEHIRCVKEVMLYGTSS